MKANNEINAYIIRSGVWAVFLSVAIIAASWAFNSTNKSAVLTAAYNTAAKIASQPERSASPSA